jgi:ATP-dependent RNA helicase DHX29
MAKKKKAALKPVARGFATTSVPKKVVEQPVEELEPVPEVSATNSEAAVPADVAEPVAQSSQSIVPTEFDPDNVEEQSLQNLVDQYQDKTEKEILRTVKVNISVS